MCDNAIDAVSALSAHAHAMLEEATKMSSAVSATLTKLRSASSDPRHQSQHNLATDGCTTYLDEEAVRVSEKHAHAMRTMEARVQLAEEKASKLEKAHHNLSVKYAQVKNERDASVHRFWNWAACHVNVVGLDQALLLTQAWSYECGWDSSISQGTRSPGESAVECKRLLDEFKAASGVFALPTTPMSAPIPLPLPLWQPFHADDEAKSSEDFAPQSMENEPDIEPGHAGDPAGSKRSNGKANMTKRKSTEAVEEEEDSAKAVSWKRLRSMQLLIDATQAVTPNEAATLGNASPSKRPVYLQAPIANTTTTTTALPTKAPSQTTQSNYVPTPPAIPTLVAAESTGSSTFNQRKGTARAGIVDPVSSVVPTVVSAILTSGKALTPSPQAAPPRGTPLTTSADDDQSTKSAAIVFKKCPTRIAKLLDKIRATKPWLQYTCVASFLPEVAHVDTALDAAVRDFNAALRHFWAINAVLLWESRFSWHTARSAIRELEDNVVLLVGQLQVLIDFFDGDNALVEFLSGAPHPAWPVMTSEPPLSLQQIYAMYGDAAVVKFLRTQSHRLWPVYPPSFIQPPPRPTSIKVPNLTWPLGETFAFVAARLLTPTLLEKLVDMGVVNPTQAFRHMSNVSRRFIQRGCPPPQEPYPFVSVVVADDPMGPHVGSAVPAATPVERTTPRQTATKDVAPSASSPLSASVLTRGNIETTSLSSATIITKTCPLKITELITHIRATKPWLQYTTVCSFLHEETHVETPHEVAVRDFNQALRHFWATSAEMLWECRFCWQTTRPTMRLLEENVVLLVGRLHLLIDLFDKNDALIQLNSLDDDVELTWPLGETFVYVASRRLTQRLLAKLADMGIPNPSRVFRCMARVARRFFEKGCPPPDEPYPFVSVVVADDPVGPQWSHGLDPPPTTHTSLRPTKSRLV
ncbi:hypothetical protein DYB28_002563 [Aphanomyces astaci]|uniref:Uncharacterized protein n=1 Tax=Aphanomyces astaci TaxID=112090 RepID=A0A9X8E3Y3_APHAT|nr:hypothetical protein DYB28_002563 [Aphanomyces astaci]